MDTAMQSDCMWVEHCLYTQIVYNELGKLKKYL